MKDILIFVSDQHSASCAGFAGDSVVRTPNLDRIAGTGTVFDAAYTSCPLCVPARMSMLSGKLPSATGVFDNSGSIPTDMATFLHSLCAEGYETVLCGRMHFEGPDQRHGFTKRIAGEITPLYTGDSTAFRSNGVYSPTLTDIGCLRIIGGGNSPTLEYDRYVIGTALAYLSRDHDRPQCLVIGTYAPHFPYVAPPELYDYYLDRVTIPSAARGACGYDHPLYSLRRHDSSEDTVRRARAAYYGMVEFLDNHIGAVYDAWNGYLRRSGREGLFVYLSDHGDQIGERSLYGKKTFFESSAGIPMIFNGNGVSSALRISEPVSIMDIGPTLCETAKAETPPEQDGMSLLPFLSGTVEKRGRHVVSEAMERDPRNGKPVPGRMIRKDNWKYVTYAGFEADDLLFDLESDPDELRNAASRRRDVIASLRPLAVAGWEPARLAEAFTIRNAHLRLIRSWVKNAELDRSEKWIPTPEALCPPESFYCSPVPLQPHLQKVLDTLMNR